MLNLVSRPLSNTSLLCLAECFALKAAGFCQSAALQQNASSAHETAPLSSSELHQAAKLARLSGICYGGSATLAARVTAEGFQFQTQGQTAFTRYDTTTTITNVRHCGVFNRASGAFRWYVAQGTLKQPLGWSAEDAATSSSHSPGATSMPANAQFTGGMPVQTIHNRLDTLVILLRGVVWRSEEVEMMKLLQNLLKFWPVSLDANAAQPQAVLQAHGGRCFPAYASCRSQQHMCICNIDFCVFGDGVMLLGA